MTVTTKNIDEVDATLRYCRKRNIFVMFSSFLPVGKFVGDNFDFRLQLSVEERKKMHDLICLIDKEEFGFEHRAWSSYVTTPCVERLKIFGDGRVSPCPGNEEIIGTVQECSIPELEQVLINRFPCHNHFCFNGNCLYRQAV
jgi:hypothetical protein